MDKVKRAEEQALAAMRARADVVRDLGFEQGFKDGYQKALARMRAVDGLDEELAAAKAARQHPTHRPGTR